MVLLPMLISYFNGCVRAHNLGIAAQIQIMEEPSLVFILADFKKVQDCVLKEERV
jgi:hypothetical protein